MKIKAEDLLEKAKKIKIVFFDIDETLAIKETNYLPQSAVEAIELLRKKGIKTAIASGRTKIGLRENILALPMDIYVLINGQYVSDAQQVIYQNPLPKTDVENFITWCEEKGIGYGFTGVDAVAVSADTQMIDACIRPVYPDVIVDALFYQKHEVYQMWTFSNQQVEQAFASAGIDQLKLIRWHEYSCDVISKTGSKAAGIDEVLKYYNISKEEAMAFGDGLNDVEMFQHVGLAVAMGKSHPELLPFADYVTKDLEHDGIYDALKKLQII